MSTYRKVDPSTLGWVKSEIDETLKQARLALEGFVENPADRTHLRFCITHLHQVVGTLLMVELDGAAMLAKEVEALAQAVLDEKTPASSHALESLTRGILMLPEYLGRLQYGHPDVPLKHLSLMNELRSARKAEPVSPLELFNPDLSVRPPASAAPTARLRDAEFLSRARQLRAEFQTALLHWLRGAPADKESLRSIAGILQELQDVSALGVLEQLFWVAGGLIEGIIDGSIEATPECKRHLARLDQQIKKIIDGTEKSALRSSSEQLVRAILLDLAHARGDGARIKQLKQAFTLDALLGGGAEDAAPPDFDMPTPEVLNSVAKALGKEIEQAQDILSTAFDSPPFDSAALAPLAELLHRMSGTLDMLGVPILKALVDELSATCDALVERRIARPDTASMPMAQALLLVESGARDIQNSSDEWKQHIEQAVQALRALYAPGAAGPSTDGIEVADAELTETEFRQLLGVVADEVGVSLGKVEEALEGFAGNPTQLARLDEIPKQLSQIQGALQILGLERTVELAVTTKNYVEAIRAGRLSVDSGVLDGLAVCIGTIGAYVEGLRAGRKNIESLIDAAMQEISAAVDGKLSAGAVAAATSASPAFIESLRDRINAWLESPHNAEAFAELQDELDALSGRDDARDPDKARRIVAEMGRLLQIVADDPETLSAEVVDTLMQSCDALAALFVPAPVAPNAGSPRPSSAATAPAREQTDEEFDEEILHIFIEDARDVFANITREFERWRGATDNAQALAELRRGYHTLKGSGRMVGAGDIAELAWAVENMLNHVRDGKIAPSAAVIDVVAQSQAVLPAMIAQLEGGPAAEADIDALRERAHALVAPRSSGGAPGATATSGDSLPRLDGTLLEIFTTEASGHLANIRQEIATCRGTGGVCRVSPALTRSIHTLQGNARSLGIRMMAEACAETEKLLHVLSTQHLPLTSPPLDMLERFAAVVTDLVAALNNGGDSTVPLADRFADVKRTAHAKHDEVALPEHAFEPPPPRAAAMPVVDTAAEDIELIGAAELEDEPAPIEIPAAAAPPRPVGSARVAPSPPSAASHAESAVDPELLEIFQEEAVDILNNIEHALQVWRADTGNTAIVLDLKRALHTLKGGARMAGTMPMGNISHATETLLTQVEVRKLGVSAALLDLLEEAHDILVSMLDRLAEGEPAPDVDDLNARLTAAAAGQAIVAYSARPAAAPQPAPEPSPLAATEVEIEAEPEEPEPRRHAGTVAPAMQPATPVIAAAPVVPALPPETESAMPVVEEVVPDRRETAGEAVPERQNRRGQIRVNTRLLNELVNYAGEVSISRARMEQQIYGFRDNLSELNRNVVRFREQLRELEIQSESQILFRVDQEDVAGSDFDPLEFDRFSKLQQLTRSLTESLHDLTTIQLNMGNFVGEAETVLQQQARINTDLQEGLMRTRMVDFSTQAARLRHIVRQTARELGKRAELNFEGSDVQIDRTVLERMIGPFEHMIRNGIDHGIETEAERKRVGKPPVGTIAIATAQEGNEIVIRFSDDGAGMNVEAIRDKAIERGLVARGANLTEDELLQFILLSGFSTASRVTQVSGRGVGMDVVHNEVKQLGGSMAVETKRGAGTTFTIRLPLTLSITQALMTYVGDQTYAVPVSTVVNIIEYPVEQLNTIAVGKNPLLNYNDRVYSYMNLSARLGIPPVARNARKVPILLTRAGNREVAIQVDGLGGTREIVIKSLGPQLSEIKGLAGATILGDGRVVLILDVPGLWYSDDVLLHVEHRPTAAVEPKAAARERPVIMVVDDSLTVRKVTGKHLQKRGFEVMVAKDGLDAVEQLRDRVPDIMLVDIEMPRMDGYELTSRIRADSRLKHVPIIIITSRAGAKHRQRAFDLGVDRYMGKPYQEEELFKNIDTLLSAGRAS